MAVKRHDELHRIEPAPERGFHFPYYLFIPKEEVSKEPLHLLVEMNNTGTTSDDLGRHDAAAKRLVEKGVPHRLARRLGLPLLVPVFPRPASNWRAYTHALDRDTLLIADGELARIDLQLLAMVDDAREVLRDNGIATAEKIFMTGFSASGNFGNRFVLLHPERVRAVATGGVNGMPILPLVESKGQRLRYHVGVADLQEVAGIDFDLESYRRVSQFIYMGYLDTNDTLRSADAYDKADADLTVAVLGESMQERWKSSEAIYRDLGIPAQFVTYDGTAHTIRSEMMDDIERFFAANSGGSGFASIEPHRYPFVELQEPEAVNIGGVYWGGDAALPDFCRTFISEQGDFVIAVEEWVQGQDHRQLDRFVASAGFAFTLRADGHADITVTRKTLIGTVSEGTGGFQGFVVKLGKAARNSMARGVAYTIHPEGKDADRFWKVRDGVTITRP